MSLSLSESCVMYERYCRRHKDIPTFEDFNKNNFTCLPSNERAFNLFRKSVQTAYRSEGLPIQRRLPSLKSMFGLSSASLATPEPTAHVAHASKSFKTSTSPSYESAMRLNIRPPQMETESVSMSTESMDTDITSEQEMGSEEEHWTLDTFKEALHASNDDSLVEKSGSMVHFVPTDARGSLSSLSCKLTKSSWKAMRENGEIKMRDGSKVMLSDWKLNEEDHKAFVKMFKKKTRGPYFIRFSSI